MLPASTSTTTKNANLFAKTKTNAKTFHFLSQFSIPFLVSLLTCLPSVPCSSSQNSPNFKDAQNSKNPDQPGVSWSSRVVTTKMGLTRGFIFIPSTGGVSENGEGVEIFLGLPYASPPLGSLRFMPPVSGSPWKGTKMNLSPAPVCPQVFPLAQTENRKEKVKMHRTIIDENFKNSENSENGEINEDGESGESFGRNPNDKSGGESFSTRESFFSWNETEILKRMPRGKFTYLKRLAPFLRNQSENCLFLNVYVPLSGN